jgi:UDP-glucose 4-epimerase
MLKKKHILIIGGNGFLGQRVVDALSDKKYLVSVFDLNIDYKKIKPNKIKHLFKYNILKNEDLDKALSKEKWDYIIHLAAFIGKGNGLLQAANENLDKAINTNVTGFANLLSKLKNKNSKIIWSSSAVVFGNETIYKDGVVNENASLQPFTNYGITKLMAEEVANYYIRKYKMNITGIRFPIIIGPGLGYRGVAAGISDMAYLSKDKKKCIIYMPSSDLDIIYIKDAADIILKIINSKTKLKNIYNCPSIRTNAKILANKFNKIYKKKYIEIKSTAEAPNYPIMDSNLFEIDTKYKIKYNIYNMLEDWLTEISS